MKLKEKIIFTFRRGSVFTSALFILKNYKAAYLLSKHPHNYNKNCLKKISWRSNGFYLENREIFLSQDHANKIQADFNLLECILKFGNIDVQKEKMIIEIENEGHLLRFNVVNHDILDLIYGIFFKKEYDLSEYTDRNITMIDVGMNVAIASLYFSTFRNVDVVYGFEPLEANYKLAIENIALNPEIGKKIHSYNYGLAEEDKAMKIPFSNSGDIGFSTTDFVLHKQRKKAGGIFNLAHIKLKNAANEIENVLMRQKNTLFCLKLDCEGAEYEIIKLLEKRNIIRKFFLLQIEWHYKGPEILVQLLIKNNFRIIYQEDHFNNYTGIIKAVKNYE